MTPLIQACIEGKAKVYKSEINQASEKGLLDERNDYGWCAIHYAVSNGRVDVVKLLIQEKCDVNAQTDVFASTPLHMAVYR